MIYDDLLSFFLYCHSTSGILVCWPGIEPARLALEAQSLNHSAAREVSQTVLKKGGVTTSLSHTVWCCRCCEPLPFIHTSYHLLFSWINPSNSLEGVRTVSWVCRLTLLDLWMCSQNRTNSYAGDLLYCYSFLRWNFVLIWLRARCLLGVMGETPNKTALVSDPPELSVYKLEIKLCSPWQSLMRSI